jgi:Zn-dependent metalloprotease
VALDTNSNGTSFELNDLTRSNSTGNRTFNLNHATSGTGTLYTDADNGWGDGANYVEGSSTTAANGQTAAVDAHFGMAESWDYYEQVHGRNGIDNTGKATYSRVHYSNSYDNAFWSDTCFCMTYGDGSSFLTLTAIDVAGHEMSHGVTATSANLAYRRESGGLNEANSDIFGTAIEFYSRGGTGGNWTIGEQLATPAYNRPLRYMYNPSLDGRSADCWSKSVATLDVHYSSGVGNHFFYLLSQGSNANPASPTCNGSSISGIGLAKAEKIWFRALTVYMTSSTNYAGARTATLNAATELFGAASAERAAVAAAWSAVNVN